jgi:hypothetical protein
LFLVNINLLPNDWEIHNDVAPGGTIKTISEKLLTKVKTLPVTDSTQIVIMIDILFENLLGENYEKNGLQHLKVKLAEW